MTFRSEVRRDGRRQSCLFPLEQIDKFTIAPRDLGDSLIARRLFAPPGNQRVPENSAADRKSHEARHRRRGLEPFADFAVVLAATENDAANSVTAAGAGGRDNTLAILAPIKPFDLPQIRFHAPILEFANGLDHQTRPQLEIIGSLVAGEPVELHLLGGHKQLEQEAAAAAGSEKIA